jgi:hypothetical protein
MTYYVEIDPGFVLDRKDLPFAGISGSTVWSFKAAENDLLFSEYIEGSGNNKALEIYNPTSNPVGLGNYRIAQSSNGGGWQYYHYFPAGAEIAAGDVWVIITNQVDPALYDAADADEVLSFPSVVHHNGNDARGLQKTLDQGDSWILIDVIGVPDEDPGSGWDVAGVSAATAEHTLLRKAGIELGNTNWASSAGTDAENSEWKVFDQDFFANLGQATPDASDQAEFAFFELRDTLQQNVTLSSVIDSNAATIDVEILFGKDSELDSLVALFEVSTGASASFEPGDTIDFTSPVVFTVTAEDGLTTKDWTVTVTVSGTASSEAEIISFSVPGSVGDATIEPGASTVYVVVPYGTDRTDLAPSIEVSAGASISPASGSTQDFTNPVVYTVTAQDGTTKDWTVTIAWESVTETDIYTIQYTEDASGDSPLIGEKVKISGVITALNIYQDQLKGYYIQDADSAWSGIYVFDEDRDLTDNPQLGDSVTVVGTVEEYYDVTELGYVEYYLLENAGADIPGPVEVATGNANQEKWESVFMRFVGAECTDNSLGFDEVEVNDGSGASRLDDRLYNYTASSDFTIGNIYHVLGVMYYSYGDFKLLPRSAGDISDVTGIGPDTGMEDLRIYPNPSEGPFHIWFASGLKGRLELRITNTSGQVVYIQSYENVGERRIAIDLADRPAGLYFITLYDGESAIVRKILIK